jgi:hypothetical protein
MHMWINEKINKIKIKKERITVHHRQRIKVTIRKIKEGTNWEILCYHISKKKTNLQDA